MQAYSQLVAVKLNGVVVAIKLQFNQCTKGGLLDEFHAGISSLSEYVHAH